LWCAWPIGPAQWGVYHVRGVATRGENGLEEVSMRRVIVSEFVSLDGVMEERWSFGSSGKEQPQYKFDELAAAEPSCWAA
jgi:hypothetical protein